LALGFITAPILTAGYGFGYFGEWGAFPVVLIAITSWALVSILAWLWMTKFTTVINHPAPPPV